MPKISCVMPTKNRGAIIADAIDSVLAQSMDDWELVLVDSSDDPADKTKTIIQKLDDSRIKYFRLDVEHGSGIAGARNYGNIMALAPYVAVMDSDDMCYPNRFKLTLDAFSEGADIVYGEVDMWDPVTGKTTKRNDEYAATDFDLERFKISNFIPHPTVAYSRAIAVDFPYNSFLKKAEDYDLLSRLQKYGFRFKFIAEPLIKYRVHDGSITKTFDGYHYTDIVRKNRGWKTIHQEADIMPLGTR